MDKESATERPACLYDIVMETEHATCLRYCAGCKTLIPPDSFKSEKKRFKCHECHRASRRAYTSSQVQRAYNGFICKARSDRELFGHASIALSAQDLFELLTADQVKDFAEWAVVPRRPDLLLAKGNATVIKNF